MSSGSRSRAAQLSRLRFLRAPRQMARRLSWGVADQAVSSLTNAAVSIYVVRSLGAVQFGAFSLAYVTYSFALNASRGLATDPLMVRFSGAEPRAWRRAVRDCTGTAVAVGLVTGVLVIAAGLLLSGTTRMAFLALGLTLPGLMLQDSWRYSFFALGRGSQAFLNDMVWALMLIPAMLFVRRTGHANVFYFILAWGASAAVAASIGPVQAQLVPRLGGTWRWLTQHRDLGLRYMLEGTTSSASNQLRSYGVGLLLGLAAVGYLGAATTLMGPMTILFLGMALVTLPEAARVLKRSPRHLPLFCVAVSAALAAAGVVWGVVLLIALPRGLGTLALGSVWHRTYPLVIPQTIYILGSAAGVGAGTGMHALGAARRSLRTMVISSAILVALAVGGAAAGGVSWAIDGTALATWIGTVIAWWQFRSALRESRREPGTAPQPGRRRRGAAAAAVPKSLDIGATLADARRQARLSVGQVSERTGIEPAVIAAIERNDFAASGTDFYTRVFIRSIARLAGIDPEPLIAAYDGVPAEPDEKTAVTNTLALILPADAAAAARPRVPLHTRGWAKMWVAPILVLAVLGLIAAAVYHGTTAQHQRHAGHAARPAPSASQATAAASPAPLLPVSITAFGPGGPRHGDNPQLAQLAIDGSAATGWRSNWYATATFGGLKAGTGLLLDMGTRVTVLDVRITLGQVRGADLELLAGDRPSLPTMRIVARAHDVGGTVQLSAVRPTPGHYLVIWFTRLPRDAAGNYQVAVYNIELTGRG